MGRRYCMGSAMRGFKGLLRGAQSASAFNADCP